MGQAAYDRDNALFSHRSSGFLTVVHYFSMGLVAYIMAGLCRKEKQISAPEAMQASLNQTKLGRIKETARRGS